VDKCLFRTPVSTGITHSLGRFAGPAPQVYALVMRWILITLLLFAVSVSAEDRPLLYVGGDGHAYLIAKGPVLLHIHQDTQTALDIGPVQGVFKSRDGVFVSAGGRIWSVVNGSPTEIGTGTLIEVGETEGGAYLLFWDGRLQSRFIPY